MSRPDGRDVVILVGSVAGASVLVLFLDDGWAEWLFYTVLLSCGATLVRAVVEGWRTAERERDRAVELVEAQPTDVARTAVREERARLAVEITAGLRRRLEAILAISETDESHADPIAATREIHHQAREASAELRRELGLLRAEPEVVAPAEQSIVARLTRRQIAMGLAVGLFGATEAFVWPLVDGQRVSWQAVTITGLVASALIGRVTAPALAAGAVGILYAVGAVGGVPVEGGFWFFLTVGGLSWALATRQPFSWRELAGGLAMVGGLTFGVHRVDPDNLGIDLVVVAAVLVAAVAVRLTGRRGSAARELADARHAVLADATAVAVEAERSSYARDLHDVVSHAVGLVAIQAGAAQVSWPRDPAGVSSSLGIITTTARNTLLELERIEPWGASCVRTGADLGDLVDRVRAAGTPVHLSAADLPRGRTAELTYRVVQEALTNVVRHAPGATAWVTVEDVADGVRVVVDDDGPGSSEADVRGFGLVGLSERVGLAGGSFSCGVGARGGFRVEALLRVDGGPES